MRIIEVNGDFIRQILIGLLIMTVQDIPRNRRHETRKIPRAGVAPARIVESSV